MAKSKTSDAKYTKPALRERLKARLLKSDKGGRAGQWSARKSQLLVQEYEKHGGGYNGPKVGSQKQLEQWTKEEWQAKDGQTRARKGKTTARYLPKKAWGELDPKEAAATDAKKRAGSRRGKQFVANTAEAKIARRKATSAAKRTSVSKPK